MLVARGVKDICDRLPPVSRVVCAGRVTGSWPGMKWNIKLSLSNTTTDASECWNKMSWRIGFSVVVGVLMWSSCATSLECGKQTIRNGRIVGGDDAFDGEFPFLASIRLGGSIFGQHHCGGVIVRKLWILTAAHCVTSHAAKSFVVRVGEFDLTRTELNHTESDHPVEKIILHPDLYKPRRYNNDVALLRLSKPIHYDDYSWPACLPQFGEDFTGWQGTTVGWGFTDENGGRRSPTLQKVQVPLMNRTQCQDLYDEAKKSVRFEKGQICAGYREGKKDSCQGDSGGPLVIRREGHFTVVGVVSAGIGCARPLLPGVYSHVPSHMEWIQNTIEG